MCKTMAILSKPQPVNTSELLYEFEFIYYLPLMQSPFPTHIVHPSWTPEQTNFIINSSDAGDGIFRL